MLLQFTHFLTLAESVMRMAEYLFFRSEARAIVTCDAKSILRNAICNIILLLNDCPAAMATHVLVSAKNAVDVVRYETRLVFCRYNVVATG